MENPDTVTVYESKSFLWAIIPNRSADFSQNGPALSETLTIAGTGDSQVLVRALAERFEAKYPDPEGSTFWSKNHPNKHP